MKRTNPNRLLSVLIGVLTLIYLYAAYQIPVFPIPRPIDSDALPKVLGFVMLGLAVWLFFERPQEADPALTALPLSARIARWLPVVITAVAIALYAALLVWLGFVLASFLLVGGLTWYYGYRRHAVNAAVALAVPLMLYLLMTRVMTVHLPPGLLPF